MRKASRQVLWLASLLFLIAFQGSGRTPEYGPAQPQQSDESTIRVDVDLVVLHATVQKRKGVPARGLGKGNFQVYEDGALQNIKLVSHEDFPVAVGLVVDSSGSMIPRRREVIAAALAFARSSNPNDQMFVVHFNEKVWFSLPHDMPFTDNVAQLEVALSKIDAVGRTALYDAVAAALAHLNKGSRDKKMLIVVSDGADNASKHTLAQIIALAEQSHAIIYTIGLFEDGDPDKNPGVLKRLAKATGGEAFLPEFISEVIPICERIAVDVRNQYTIAYASTNKKQDGTFRAIEVKAAAAGGGRLLVRTRAGYYAPAPAAAPAAGKLR